MSSSNRLWVLGTVVLSIALLALGWFIGVSPRLDEISAAIAQKIGVDQQNQITSAKIAQLKADYQNLDAVSAQLDQLRLSIPASADYTGFLQELNSIAGKNSTKLTSFVPSAPTLVTTDGSAPAATDGSATGTATTALADGALVSIPLSLSATGSSADLLDFVGDLQSAKRLVLTTSLNLAEAGDGFTLTVSGYMFVNVDSSVTAAGDAVSGPQPTQTPTPSESASNTPTGTPTP